MCNLPSAICFIAQAALVLGWVCDAPGAAPPAADQPIDPASSINRFELDPGFRIELVASEPEVIDPVDIAFDTDGSLWVVEMRDYPRGASNSNIPSGRVRRLRDHSGDGKFDTAEVFLDELLFPTGIQLWKNGAILTVSGKLLFACDTNSDGRADTIETWIEGFAEENSQLRANHPTLAWNHWLYVANGLRGGTLQLSEMGSASDGNESRRVKLSSFDLRMNLKRGELELITGVAQFGMTFDDAGNRYVCSNRNPCIEIVMEQSDVARSPLAGLTTMTRDSLPAGDASRLHPLTEAWTTSNLHASQFTAACGVLMTSSLHFPPSPFGHVLVCEPTANLVHHRAMQRVDGKTLPTEASSQKEFLASRDPWFRPVNLKIGPDDAIYVIDMYRCVIEHPDWVPDELKNRPDERDGDDRGRIYRIVRSDFTDSGRYFQELANSPLSERSNESLVALLGHSHTWYREVASRLLYERGLEPSQVGSLRQICSSARHRDSKLRAASLLDQSGLLDSGTRNRLLNDRDPFVRAAVWREQLGMTIESEAIDSELLRRLCDSLRSNEFDEALAAAWSLSDPSAISLARVVEANPAEIDNALIDFLGSKAIDGRAWMAAAPWLKSRFAVVFPTLHDHLVASYEDLSSDRLPEFEAVWSSLPKLASYVRPGQATREGIPIEPTHIRQWLNDVIIDLGLPETPRFEQRWLLAMIEGLLLSEFADEAKRESTLWERISSLAEDERCAKEIRVPAIRLLGMADSDSTLRAMSLLSRTNDPEIARAAIAARGRRLDPSLAPFLIERLPTALPAERMDWLQLLVSDEDRLRVLLDAMESKTISPSLLDATFWQRLSSSPFPSLRPRIERLLSERTSAGRAEVVERYLNCFDMTPDLERGRELFRKHCASCHRIGEDGFSVGPDISDSTIYAPQQLLISILDPNRAIDNNYFRYVVLTMDGRVVDGVIVETTSGSIMLRGPNGQTSVLNRDEIAELKSTGVSLMPEGFEEQIPLEDMADLIGFLKNWRYLENSSTGTIRARLR